MGLFSLPDLKIANSVGRKGKNRPDDVTAVQSQLNALSPPSRTALAEDGVNGKKTMGAIEDFQKLVVGLTTPDGRVDPGGKTERALNSRLSTFVWAGQSMAVPASPVRPRQNVSDDVPHGNKGALFDDREAMRVLTAHLERREGVVRHFYCDSKDYVTIGVGCLVDRDTADTAARERTGSRRAKELVTKWGVSFKRLSDGQPASLDEVAEDWHRVFKGGKGEKGSASIAKLRMDPGYAETLARKQAIYFCNGMYRKKPVARKLHSWIQMALIDARWNPAGTNPWWSGRSDIVKMWALLDPDSPKFDPLGAQRHFAAAWKDAGGDKKVQYQTRVAWRNDRFYEGAMRMSV